MPCGKCGADFTVFLWKIKCYECEENYCSKCLNKIDGDTFCETCAVLIKRPPVRTKLMELKSKDLQSYLNKHNVSTRGIVEKQELVELFYKSPIPPKDKRKHKRFNCNFSGSVPNLAQRSQTYLNNLRTSAETAFNSRNWAPGGTHGSNGNNGHGHSAQSTPIRTPQATSPNRPSPGTFNTSNTTFTTFTINNDPPHVFSTTTSSGMGGGSVNSSAGTSNSSYGTTPNTTTHNTATSTPQPPPNAPSAEQPESSPQVPKKYPKLSDFQSPDDFNDLSVKQLKELLSLNRVDYKGCVEKAELLERASRLWIDSNIRKEEGDTDGNMDEACKICMDAPLDCVLLECGHMATCIDCGKRLAECPICRQYVTRVVRTFKA